ncbi:uncharacterized protein [Primulina eburnea]|uniref:uncharacterized protein isoform X1 n=2 Tax=Primulina eburnea TaxID=1245227 RepID=UPI003C6BED35
MSFPNNRIWMPIRSGSQDNEEVADVSARNEHKRGYQWFVGSHEQELFFNKKQSIESDNKGTSSGATVTSYPLWSDISSSQPGGHIGDHLVNPITVQSSDLSQNNVFSTVSTDPHMEKGGSEDQFGIDLSTCFSMSQTVEDPLYLNSGVRKVMVDDIRILQNCLPEFVQNSNPGKKNEKPCTIFQNVEQACSKRDGMVKNQFFSGLYDNTPSISQAFNRRNYDTGSIEKSSGNFMSIGSTCQGQENFLAMNPFYNKANETFNISASSTYNKGDGDFTSLTYIHSQQDATFMPQRTVHSKENSTMLSLGENHENGEQTTISFGGFQDDPDDSDTSGRLICSRDILLSRLSAQSSAALGQRNFVEQITANVASVAAPRTDGTLKNLEPKIKKGTSNNFPANVKSLLSTGILDGIPVKYISWSREKNLRGVVKGTGYLCSCQDCKLSKVINAYEFECHAGCKTKHPNNHIYFENGKTIYAVVQELRGTPQEILLEAIQNVTGSPINQKNFHNWKASYQAATRELHHIYGKDDTIVAS